MLNDEEHILLEHYNTTLSKNGIPKWAFQFPPPIPFVGNRFSKKSPKVMVYGSAENLTYTIKNTNSEIFSIGEACKYRHKYFYLNYKNDGLFPYVHIQPINDGSLLTTARFCLYKMNKDFLFSQDPKGFIDEICVANFGKFSVEDRINKDYASDNKTLSESLTYVVNDLKCIKPDIVILPGSIYNTVDRLKGWQTVKALSQLDKEICFIRIYQTNVRVINTHVSRALNGSSFCYKDVDWLRHWVTNSISNMEKYVSWLDQKFNDIVTYV